jgi:hypothetical protein
LGVAREWISDFCDGEESALLALRAQFGFVRGDGVGFGDFGERARIWARAVLVTQEEPDAL